MEAGVLHFVNSSSRSRQFEAVGQGLDAVAALKAGALLEVDEDHTCKRGVECWVVPRKKIFRPCTIQVQGLF